MTPSRTQSRVGRADSFATSRVGCCAAVQPDKEAIKALTSATQQMRLKRFLPVIAGFVMQWSPLLLCELFTSAGKSFQQSIPARLRWANARMENLLSPFSV